MDKDRLSDILANWKTVARSVKDGGVTFAEGLRWLSGLKGADVGDDTPEMQSWTRVISGKWLKQDWNPYERLMPAKSLSRY